MSYHIAENMFHCKCRMYSITLSNFMKAYAGCTGSLYRWYSWMPFYQKRFHNSRAMIENNKSVVTWKASKPWWGIAWRLRKAFSNLSTVTFCETFSMKIFAVSYDTTVSEKWIHHFLYKERRPNFQKACYPVLLEMFIPSECIEFNRSSCYITAHVACSTV